MAGPFEQSLEEVHILFDSIFLPSENTIDNSDQHAQSSSTSGSPISRTIKSEDALITRPPSLLELRQNNAQDCQNLIIASVDRATVEISRTIIALNATFSQQLQQASISASNGIKSAQDSASSSIGVVVSSADIATSSASFMLTIANRQVVSATSALADVSLSSSSDVAILSSSLGQLQASLSSMQASASAAIAAAQAAIASATGSAAAQASSLLASANARLSPTATQTVVGAGQTVQPLPSFPVPTNISLTPGQIAGIIVGAVAASVLLSLAAYFAIVRLKRRKHDSYMDEKYDARSPKEVHSRSSSAPRTGNTMTLKFNPPKSSDVPPPTKSALRNDARSSVGSPPVPQISPLQFQGPPARNSSSSTNITVWNQQQPPVAATEWPVPSSSKPGNESGSFDLPAPEASGALAAPDRLGKRGYRSGGEPSEEHGSLNPFSDPRESKREELDDPFEDVSSLYSIPDAQAYNFRLSTNSTAQIAEEAGNPFNDPATTYIDPSWDKYRFSDAQIFTKPETPQIEESKPRMNTLAQYQYEDEPVKTTISEPEPAANPSILQLQTAFVEKPSSRMEQRLQAPELTPTKPSFQDTNYVTPNQPEFLKNYIPPTPESEKIPSPPPRRRPSLGSIRPLRKMLPPRQKTVSPPRQVNFNRGEGSNRFPPKLPQGAQSREPFPPILKSVTTEITVSDQSSRPSSKELREAALSPLRRNPVLAQVEAELAIATKDVESEIPIMLEKAQESKQQQKSSSRSLLLDGERFSTAARDGEGVEEAENNDREYRGRSMIRTSDIIEARLSIKSQNQENRKSLPTTEARINSTVQKSQPIISSKSPSDKIKNTQIGIGESPLRRNPVDMSSIPRIPMHRRTKTLPPPRQHIRREHAAKRRSRSLSPIRLVNKFLQLERSPIPSPKSPFRVNPSNLKSTKRRSRSLSPPRQPNPSLKSLPHSISRENSPLRRNPTRTYSPMVSGTVAVDSTPTSTSARVPKAARNGLFAQSLSKFQNLASQNPQDAIIASTEVTQRAIAGIYIPGSLREQAVRTVSKSREGRLRDGGKDE
ncbi:hypothetical protein ONS95_013407 [Cadophora gregata]|uniref:uncharacterized protein n=1 Tax=Cadophora gregata TaxID=51156 RepID=UPI0026DB3C8B|nr:uncharacterized protein ONS95_013407 [Cadophora gregata]KAK0099700.1 hypothetical protein ONS96_008197 [Cadophora gregata f. sp. sojae]KAK0116387.1 hypothetical protein ONS95_013407 [Cadophora gregata]